MIEVVTKDYFKLVIKIILFILFLIGLYFIRDIVLMLIVSIILAALFIPTVDWLERKRVSRLLSTLLIYLLLVLVFVSIIFIVVPIFSSEFNFFVEKISFYYQNLRSLFGPDQKILPENPIDLSVLSSNLGFWGQGVFSFIGSVANWLFTCLIVFILSFYITLEKKSLVKSLVSFFPEKHHNFINKLLVLTQRDLSAWGLGMLIMVFAVGILTYAGLLILNLRFALVLAVFAAVTEIIPWIGPFIGAVPAVFIALFQSPMTILLVILLYIIVQQIVNNIVAPIVLNKAVGLDPIIIITVLLIGARFGGIFGAIISVPVTAVLAIFLREYRALKNGASREL